MWGKGIVNSQKKVNEKKRKRLSWPNIKKRKRKFQSECEKMKKNM